MSKSLLTIDWDYFIKVYSKELKSYQESEYNILSEWYKDYLDCKERGVNIKKLFGLSKEVEHFWEKIEENIDIKEKEPIILSDSHKVAYNIAKQKKCDTIYLIDAHSDLGYGGIKSLEFEVNCANWLGKLFKEKEIKKAYIIYSPYTHEQIQDFKEIIDTYDIEFLSFKELIKKKKEIKIDALHICRSGSWTPPWYDKEFLKFLYRSRRELTGNLQELRTWEPKGLNLADQIECMLGI